MKLTHDTYFDDTCIVNKMVLLTNFDLCIPMMLRLRNAAFELQLSYHVWGSWIKRTPLICSKTNFYKTILSRRKPKQITQIHLIHVTILKPNQTRFSPWSTGKKNEYWTSSHVYQSLGVSNRTPIHLYAYVYVYEFFTLIWREIALYTNTV